ncbi:hypothetical protein [Bradyrhizobium australiense]|uniref:hypothetical protein n=1 Tax=Bradyrhizobium australiense TaxID=2721161 RepID=UPI0028A0B72C|nr:hypothetical protein [Bradyrhizobium australiense]
MKSLLLAGAMMVATGTCAFAQAVLGGRQPRHRNMRDCHEQSHRRRPGRRKHLVRNRSLQVARQARSTISQCPAVEEPAAEMPEEDKSN